MTAGYALFERWKQLRGFKTSAEAATELGVSEGSPSNWKHQRSHPEEAHVIKMADELGEDAAVAVLTVQAERKKERDPNRLALMKLAKKLAAFVPVLMLGLAQSENAKSVEVHNYNSSQFYITADALYIHVELNGLLDSCVH